MDMDLELYEEERRPKDNQCYWPQSGRFVLMYKMWMLAHCCEILAFSIARVAFEQKPWIYVVYIEWYMDIVYLIDMIRIFGSPITGDNGKFIYNRKTIIKNYLTGWFLWDLFAFYPLAYLRFISNRADGGRDDIANLLN